MRNRYLQIAAFAFAILCVASTAWAQYESGFESLYGTPEGIVLTGQEGYYIPSGTTSVDFKVYTYAGNVLAYPQNPEGGNQFIAGVGPGGGTYARAQNDIFYIFGGQWKFQYDVAVKFTLTGASSQNVGSFSVRSDEALGLNDYIHLMTWVDANNPTNFNAWYLAYDASGTQFSQPGQSPGPAWDGLMVDHWYRMWTVIDVDANTVLEVGIKDLETQVESVVQPTGWYLDGGAAGGGGFLPEAFRFFAGGSNNGNSTAWDNIKIIENVVTPTGACCVGSNCTIQTQADCTAMGGNYVGDGSTCEPTNPCATAIKPSTWGGIKAGYR